MNDYTFQTLSSDDFERFVCDLFNEEETTKKTGINFRSFKKGKDQGIDLLFSSKQDELDVVVQVKHYVDTGLNGLIRTLKNEKDTIEKLSSNRYIVATSVPLSLANKQKIKNVLAPHINNISDIYGKEDLNMLLSKHPKVEENHFKLWFSSTTVFQKILRNQYEGRNEFEKTRLLENIKLHVITPAYHEAWSILKNKQILIIAGDPGVGKTTLAELLLYKLIGEDYELNYVYTNIYDVEKKIKNDNSKQVFYFDDFLGSTAKEISKAREAESVVLNTFNRIRRSPGKLFILTTRNIVLKAALNDSEKLRREKNLLGTFQLKLDEYDIENKITIFKNHLAVKKVKDEYKNELDERKLVLLSKHENFTPRLIDFVTTENNYIQVEPDDYYNWIKKQLDQPEEIWRHAFEQQIQESDQFLIMTLYSLGSRAIVSNLEAAYEKRICYEIKVNNYSRPINIFNNCLRKLEGGFLEIYHQGEICTIRFINPSVEDFVKLYLDSNRNLVKSIALSMNFAEQFSSIVPFLDSSTASYIARNLDNQLREIESTAYSDNDISKTYGSFLLAWLFTENLPIKESESQNRELLNQIDWGIMITPISEIINVDRLFELIEYSKYDKSFLSRLRQYWKEIFSAILTHPSDRDIILGLIQSSSYLINDPHEFLEKNGLKNNFNHYVLSFFDSREFHFLEELNYIVSELPKNPKGKNQWVEYFIKMSKEADFYWDLEDNYGKSLNSFFEGLKQLRD